MFAARFGWQGRLVLTRESCPFKFSTYPIFKRSNLQTSVGGFFLFFLLLSKFALSSVLKLESLRKPDVISAFIYLFIFWMEAIYYHPDFPRCAGIILLPKKKRKWIQSRSIRNTFNKNEKSHEAKWADFLCELAAYVWSCCHEVYGALTNSVIWGFFWAIFVFKIRTFPNLKGK